MARTKNKPETLCWDCKRAIGNCPWSRSGTTYKNGVRRVPQPVEGWKATKSKIHVDNRYEVDSYLVQSCPLFIRDDKREVPDD